MMSAREHLHYITLCTVFNSTFDFLIQAEKKRMLKTERKAQQDANVAKKKIAEDEKKAAKASKRRKLEDCTAAVFCSNL